MNVKTKFDYGDTVQITAGKRIGTVCEIVGISCEQRRTYTVEFADGSDCEIPEDSLSSYVFEQPPDGKR